MSAEEQTGDPEAPPADERDPPAAEEPSPGADLPSERYSAVIDRFVRGVELAAATVFAALFAIGVVDLVIQIGAAVASGGIADPNVVIGFIDTGLLLLIIIEVYQTVLAYVEENDTRRIVRLVIYTGVIAMVRKVIVFRTSEYATVEDALLAAAAYALVIVALVGLLYAERAVDDGTPMPE